MAVYNALQGRPGTETIVSPHIGEGWDALPNIRGIEAHQKVLNWSWLALTRSVHTMWARSCGAFYGLKSHITLN